MNASGNVAREEVQKMRLADLSFLFHPGREFADVCFGIRENSQHDTEYQAT